jgi:hypothetical protein
VGIRSFHEFDAQPNGAIVCRAISNSMNSKSFSFKLDSDSRSPIKRILDTNDLDINHFVIIQQDDTLRLAQINSCDLQKVQVTVSLFFPALPTKKFSCSKSTLQVVPTTSIVGRLVNPPLVVTTKSYVLSNEQFIAIQDICDEF